MAEDVKVFKMEDNNTNDTNCSDIFTQEEKNKILILLSSVGLVSVSVCVLTISLACYWKLHKKFIYRLAMYQVFSSMLFGIFHILVISLTSYFSNEKDIFYHVMCQLTGYLLTYSLWASFLFTSVLVLHFFLLAVCLKDSKKLEILYFGFSMAFPMPVSCIPLIHNSYGPTGVWCWIKYRNSDCTPYKEGTDLRIALWLAPNYVFLVFSALASVIVFLVLLWRCASHRNSVEEDSLVNKERTSRYKKALLEVSPLLIYPVIFFTFHFLGGVFNAVPHEDLKMFLQVYSLVGALLGIFTSTAFLVHIAIAKFLNKKKRVQFARGATAQRTGEYRTVKYTSCTGVTTTARTTFVIPKESDIDDSH